MPKSARFSNRQGNSRSMSRPGCFFREVNGVLLGIVALLRTIRFIMLDLPSLNPRGNIRKQMSNNVKQGKGAAMVIPPSNFHRHLLCFFQCPEFQCQGPLLDMLLAPLVRPLLEVPTLARLISGQGISEISSDIL